MREHPPADQDNYEALRSPVSEATSLAGPPGTVHETGGDESDSARRSEQHSDHPSVWIGSWLDYNNGITHGDWIPADQPDEDIWAAIETILARSPTTARTGEPAEDWGVFDYDHFGPLLIAEQETVSWIGAVGRGITEHGLAFAAWADVCEDAELLDGFNDHYLGEFDSLQDYVVQLIDDLGYDEELDRAVPDHLRSYVHIDTDQLARDMELSGDVYVLRNPAGGVWLFDAR